MFKTKFRIPVVLSLIIIILAIITSVGGIAIEGLYRDNEAIKAVWLGNDIITLVIAVPMMVWALVLAMRGSVRAHLIWMGSLWYMLYNYMFYVYGAVFNKFYLLYVVLFTLSAYALIFALVKTDAKGISEKFSPRTPVKLISIYNIFFAISLGTPWVMLSLSYVFTDVVPDAIVRTGTVVLSTDLSILISAMVVNAILLWKRQPWGYIMSVVVMTKGLLYPLVLLFGGIIAYYRTGSWDPLTPLYVFLGAGCVFFWSLLLRNLQATKQSRTSTPVSS